MCMLVAAKSIARAARGIVVGKNKKEGLRAKKVVIGGQKNQKPSPVER